MANSLKSKTEFGARIKERRESLKLTQPQAAKLAGISQPSWSAIEAGDTTPKDIKMSTVVGIAKALRWEEVELPVRVKFNSENPLVRDAAQVMEKLPPSLQLWVADLIGRLQACVLSIPPEFRSLVGPPTSGQHYRSWEIQIQALVDKLRRAGQS